MPEQRFRIGVIGTYGNGNLGDEAIFVAFLQWLKEHAPRVSPISLCVNPKYVQQIYGLPAYAVSAHHVSTGSAEIGIGADSPLPTSVVERDGEVPQTRSKLKASLRIALKRQLPIPIKALRSAVQVLKDLLAVSRFFPAQIRMARSLDAVVVLGGGQIHDFWDGPLGHPATLFLWALACRMTRTPFFIASVGAVNLRHRLSRWFVRGAFKWSAHATVRDRASAEIIESLGVRNVNGVLPDLAWGLAATEPVRGSKVRDVAQAKGQADGPRTIGVSPMVYRHPQLWPGGDAKAYAEYVDKTATFCNRLIREGYEVVLFPTQIRSDTVAIQDVVARVAPDLASRLRVIEVAGIAQLLACLAAVDVVVTTRFHGLLLSLLAERPAISISYQQKNDALLDSLGQGHFALDVHDFSIEMLWEKFERLREEFAAYAADIAPHLERNRALLAAQYVQIFTRLGWRPFASESAPTTVLAP